MDTGMGSVTADRAQWCVVASGQPSVNASSPPSMKGSRAGESSFRAREKATPPA
ncbi:MAG: hypothetical protein OXI54_02520 [Chloroflexota bacterium]|nr:hypothetical protein [Chloroflexota bacterium]MDE2683010.1 hypothetical protein [Chloroflexota bacterium]